MDTVAALSLLNGNQVTTIAAFIVGGTTLGFAIIFITFRRTPEKLIDLFSSGGILRLLATGLLIGTATVLALTGKLSSEISTLFSGIAGFILGGITKPKKQREEKR